VYGREPWPEERDQSDLLCGALWNQLLPRHLDGIGKHRAGTTAWVQNGNARRVAKEESSGEFQVDAVKIALAARDDG